MALELKEEREKEFISTSLIDFSTTVVSLYYHSGLKETPDCTSFFVFRIGI